MMLCEDRDLGVAFLPRQIRTRKPRASTERVTSLASAKQCEVLRDLTRAKVHRCHEVHATFKTHTAGGSGDGR